MSEDLETQITNMLSEWLRRLRTEQADPRLSHYAWRTLITAIIKFVREYVNSLD